ncbi:MAG: hypothetical protein EBY07_17325, partial [Actinobacteria bacterium]|nr:hypothetical protein [Actinomycetota bacterium]
ITIAEGVETIPLPGGFSMQYRINHTKYPTLHGADVASRDLPPYTLGIARATHAALTAQADEIDRLTTENAEFRKDAERYRWLRSGGYPIQLARSVLNDTPFGIDARIDAAMAAKEST